MLMAEAIVRDISPHEYAGFQRLVAQSSGIALGASKRQLLVGRVLRLVRERGLPSFGAYLDLVRADASGGELVRLLDVVATNETRFFRERTHYDYLVATRCPEWRGEVDAGARTPRLRVWSAACSTGQEPYSIAMTLLSACPPADGWSLEVLASDLSTRALGVAERGEYDAGRSGEIPEPHLRRFMRRGVGAKSGRMRASPELRDAVRFLRINLNESLDEAHGTYDLFFCCNALIYFSRAGRVEVVRRLVRKLAPGGRLFVGHAESLHEHRDILRAVAPTVYALATDTNPRDRTL
jgi:chemotaxis protein methyltransferase CheR